MEDEEYAKVFGSTDRWWIFRARALGGWCVFSPGIPGQLGFFEFVVDTHAEAVALVGYALDYGHDMLGFTLIGLRERGMVR